MQDEKRWEKSVWWYIWPKTAQTTCALVPCLLDKLCLSLRKT
nr:MAG TPA: hypothetical protein [Caudoviricetes sp.]